MSLADMAVKMNEEINGQSSTFSNVPEEKMMDNVKAIKPGAAHLKEEKFRVAISFHGSFNDFKQGVGNTWEMEQGSSKIKSQGSEKPGDYVVGNDGHTYRRLLTNASIQNIKNSSPVAVGIKFIGLPVTSHCLVKSGHPEVDLVIPPETHQLTQVNESIHENEWDAQGIMSIVEGGWASCGKEDVKNSILEKGKIGWKLTDISPIVGYAMSRRKINENTLFEIPDKKKGKITYLMDANLAENIERDLYRNFDTLPFHDPEGVKATLVRMDSPEKWTEPKIGGSINHPTLRTSMSNPEYIGCELVLNYALWQIS